ncbi:MAG: hypothetical protein U1A22_12730 [Xanthomonadaceae bacterium]|nr:hypothetical protein [Xanthomonadaceae bacterium]
MIARTLERRFALRSRPTLIDCHCIREAHGRDHVAASPTDKSNSKDPKMTHLHAIESDVREATDHVNTLSIARNDWGTGNAANGLYTYRYETRSLMANAGDTLTIKIVDRSGGDGSGRYVFYGYSCTRPSAIEQKRHTHPATSVTFDIDLEKHELASISIVVQDTMAKTQTLIICDPQVGNDPQT